MAETRVTWQYTVIFTKAEFVLVGKALRGAMKPAEQQEALELQKSMARAKHKVLEQALAESQKLIDNIDDAEEKVGP